MKTLKVSEYKEDDYSSSISIAQEESAPYIDGYNLYARGSEKSNETASLLIIQVEVNNFSQLVKT
jgi:hypothetical protein